MKGLPRRSTRAGLGWVLLLICLTLACQTYRNHFGPVRILPEAAEVEQGCLFHFRALQGTRVLSGRWVLGNPTAGVIDASGEFRAGFLPGTYEVSLLSRRGSLLAKASFRVTPATHQLATSNVAELYDPVSDRIQVVGSMARGRCGAGAALLPDGRVLVIGGRYAPSDRDPLEAEVFDPVTGTFSPFKTQPLIQRSAPAVLALSDGRIALLGGVPYGEIRSVGNTFEVFDPVTGKFAPHEANTRSGRALAGALALKDGSVLLWGRGLELWEPAYGILSLSCEPAPGAGASACELEDGQVLLSGGFAEFGGGVQVPLDTAWLVNPKDRSVRLLKLPGGGRFGHFSFPLGGGVAVVGGSTREELPPVQMRDPAGNAFALGQGQLVPAPGLDLLTAVMGSSARLEGLQPAEWGTGIALDAYRALMVGGRQQPTASLHVVDASAKTVTAGPELQVKRRTPTLVQLKDGRILILGGETGVR